VCAHKAQLKSLIYVTVSLMGSSNTMAS